MKTLSAINIDVADFTKSLAAATPEQTRKLRKLIKSINARLIDIHNPVTKKEVVELLMKAIV